MSFGNFAGCVGLALIEAVEKSQTSIANFRLTVENLNPCSKMGLNL